MGVAEFSRNFEEEVMKTSRKGEMRVIEAIFKRMMGKVPFELLQEYVNIDTTRRAPGLSVPGAITLITVSTEFMHSETKRR